MSEQRSSLFEFRYEQTLALVQRLYPKLDKGISEVLAGAAAICDQANETVENLIETAIERWNTTVNDEPSLHEWLGLTWDEYKTWVEDGRVRRA